MKKRRNNDLLAIQGEASLADHRRMIGQTVSVLVEGPSKNALKHDHGSGPKQLTGRTMTDHIVVFDGNPRLIGQTLPVRIREATSFTLFGDVLTGEQVGVEKHYCDEGCAIPAAEGKRFGLPVV